MHRRFTEPASGGRDTHGEEAEAVGCRTTFVSRRQALRTATRRGCGRHSSRRPGVRAAPAARPRRLAATAHLDSATADALHQIGTDHPELVKSAEVVSDVFDPKVFRIALTLTALVYLIHGERHHAIWLVVTVFGGAAIGFALKVIVGRARPVLPDPLSTAPGMSFPSGDALGASIGCCLLLLIALRFLPRGGRIAAVIAAGLIVGSVGLAWVVLGVHFLSDVLAGITLGIGWVAVTTWAYVAWRRETGQPVERPADVGTPEHPVAPR
jgi:membrane-associated phospholipid phosphatase